MTNFYVYSTEKSDKLLSFKKLQDVSTIITRPHEANTKQLRLACGVNYCIYNLGFSVHRILQIPIYYTYTYINHHLKYCGH